MKQFIKLVCIIMAVVLCFTLGAVGCGNSFEPIDISKEYTALVGGKGNDQWLFYNPDRGYRTEWVIPIKRKAAEHPGDDFRTLFEDETNEELLKKISQGYSMYFDLEDYTPKLVILYISFTEYGKLDALPDRALEILDLVFDFCRKKKTKVLFRCAYNTEHGNWKYDEEYKAHCESVCADEATMIKHIKQLAPLIAKNVDVVHKMSSGFIGNGEMVYSFQYPEVDFENVIKAIVEEICVPNNLQFSVRMPEYKINLETEDPDYQYLNIIGFNNDAVFGEQKRYGMHSGCWQYDHNGTAKEANCNHNEADHEPNDWWNYVIKQAAYTSQSGELFVNSHFFPNYVPTGMEVILQMAHHRFTTLSSWHTLGEIGNGTNTADTNVMIRWIETETVTPQILEENGILYDPAWFYDSDGAELSRNPYEFIRDHLGYKLVAEKSSLKGELGKDGKVNVEMTFKNYGFAAAFMLESGFAILDENYNLVSSVKAGEPDKWYNLAPDYYVTERKSSAQSDVITHNISAELKLPKESGKYYIAFYLKNTMNDFATLSNDSNSIAFEGDGYNILHEIEIK